MNVMICFEVSSKNEQVRKELASKGYMTNWKVKRGKDEITFHLPSNAMWKKGEHASPVAAKEDLSKAAKKLNVEVSRTVALVIGKWDGIRGSSAGSESSVKQTAEMSE